MNVYLTKLKIFSRYLVEDLNFNIELPIEKLKLPADKGEINKKALTKKELESLLLNLEDNKYYIVVFIAENTGMRVGEIASLTLNDIDFNNHIIDVNKQWKVLSQNNYNFGTLKSKNSYRTIPVSNNFINELKKYKKENPTDIYNRVISFTTNCLEKKVDVKLQKLAGISIHELRHTYATTLISNGIDFKTVAQILGHDVEQTMRTYSHVNDDMVKRATNIIENIF